ncbi:uncharacterized protein LOC121385794 [Gigantopelta aegis]|uniref:uncharacterized protein LOC121385794 n=1 Tax=Gigantopelta aegis TaxID=1735272 RepID=UPI001B888B66|nr:uncharacterized protein LOC121385794 [Gigantopelta aegis]XP_041372514.1 uncharacterized protein LOC121385794 [Gigantopelta aegis]
MPIKKAAAVFSVPYSTLHDRVSGKIQLQCTRSGPEALLSQEEEQTLVQHIEFMSSVGYGYTRTEVTGIATDFAVYIGKKEKEGKNLSLQWFYSFMKRWPELKVQKPRSLEIMRAKATSEETVNIYFNELETILNKYNLKNSPQSIYNIDEKGIVENHKPPSVVSSRFEVPVAVTLGKSNTTTVIGCGNALGVAIPPYFVFKGQRMHQELLSGCTAGTAGTVSETGWSNSEIFQMYLSDHFTKYAPPASSDQPILILYDGHKSHINISLIQWARERNIIIFVLPAHTSHVLQPMDVGCFGPFETIYSGMKHTYLREHATSGIDRYSLCEIACKAYCSALTPVNLQASFRKTGIYPFNRSVLKPSNFLPATVFSSTKIARQQESGTVTTDVSPSQCNKFFRSAEEAITRNARPTKKRKVLSAVVGGKAITEDDILENIQKHQEQQQKKKPLPKRKPTKPRPTNNTTDSQMPSTSGVSSRPKANRHVANDSDTSDEEPEDSNDLCCKCKRMQPEEFRHCVSLCFVSWAQCTHPSCNHWVHLKFCTSVRVVRRNSEFWCPCHIEQEE